MAWTAPSTWVSGAILTAAQLNQQLRDNMLELAPFFSNWNDYTPTLSNGWALGNATYVAKYLKVGNFVSFYTTITIGSSTTKGATAITIALPVTAVDKQSLNCICGMADVGIASYAGWVLPDDCTTTTVVPKVMKADGTHVYGAGVTSTVPFTWGTGDLITVSGTFVAA